MSDTTTKNREEILRELGFNWLTIEKGPGFRSLVIDSGVVSRESRLCRFSTIEEIPGEKPVKSQFDFMVTAICRPNICSSGHYVFIGWIWSNPHSSVVGKDDRRSYWAGFHQIEGERGGYMFQITEDMVDNPVVQLLLIGNPVYGDPKTVLGIA